MLGLCDVKSLRANHQGEAYETHQFEKMAVDGLL